MLKKLSTNNSADGVRPKVLITCIRVPVPEKAGQRLNAADFEGFTMHVSLFHVNRLAGNEKVCLRVQGSL